MTTKGCSPNEPSPLSRVLAKGPPPALACRTFPIDPKKGNCDPEVWCEDIDDRFRGWTLADYSPAAVGAACRFLADPHSWSLLICGGLGTRKTSLAAAIVRAVRQQFGLAWLALFVSPAAALRVMVTCNDIAMRRWSEAPLLVWDDIGAMRDTPHLHAATLDILRQRYDNLRKTIITSNADRDGLRAFDERLADRLKEGVELFAGKESRR